MKLLKRDRVQLERILIQMERGYAFLMQESTLVCKTRPQATTTEDYVRSDGKVCVSITKEAGSELCLLESGIHALRIALFGEPS